MTVPASREVIAIAMVAVRTNRHSCVVEVKHSGRALSVCTGSIVSVAISVLSLSLAGIDHFESAPPPDTVMFDVVIIGTDNVRR